MKLTTAILATYIGGQIEVQNGIEGYLYRGEIKTAEVDGNDELAITLNWMAKGEGIEKGDGPPIPTGWIKDEKLKYNASLLLYSVIVIGPSSQGGDNRLCLISHIIGETVVLFPANGSKLDPAKVRGLELNTA